MRRRIYWSENDFLAWDRVPNKHGTFSGLIDKGFVKSRWRAKTGIIQWRGDVMIDLSEFIVGLWLYPAVALLFVVLVAVIWFLYSLVKVFMPVAGPKRKPIKNRSQQEKMAWVLLWFESPDSTLTNSVSLRSITTGYQDRFINQLETERDGWTPFCLPLSQFLFLKIYRKKYKTGPLLPDVMIAKGNFSSRRNCLNSHKASDSIKYYHFKR